MMACAESLELGSCHVPALPGWVLCHPMKPRALRIPASAATVPLGIGPTFHRRLGQSVRKVGVGGVPDVPMLFAAPRHGSGAAWGERGLSPTQVQEQLCPCTDMALPGGLPSCPGLLLCVPKRGENFMGKNRWRVPVLMCLACCLL